MTTAGRFRVAAVTTHPIQYQVPWFQALARSPDVDLTVFFGMIPNAHEQGDGFGVDFEWDVPLLEGYRYLTLANVARRPSLTAFRGCDTPGIRSALARERFDCVLVNGWVAKCCLQALYACRRQGIPCVVRGESNALRPRPPWIRFGHRLLLRQYSAFLAIGESNREFYLRNGVPPDRVFDGPYCVDNDRFARRAGELEDDRASLRAAWGIPPDACTFLFCGKLVPKKRPLDVLRALERLPAMANRVHVLIAGDGPLRAECEAFSLARRLPVTFAGFLNQSEVSRAYVAADCLVLPSDDGETWGLVVNEAMASGRAALVSDRVGCAADLVRPGATGDRFPCGNVDALAAALGAWAGDPARLRRAGEEARRHVGSYSIARLVAGTRQAIRHVVGHREAA